MILSLGFLVYVFKCEEDLFVASREFCRFREAAKAHGKVVFDGLGQECITLHPNIAAMTDTHFLEQVLKQHTIFTNCLTRNTVSANFLFPGQISHVVPPAYFASKNCK